MAIVYPISLAGLKQPRSVTFRTRSAVGMQASPFTYQPQTYAWRGQLLMADVQYPPMSRADAEELVAALVSLNGREGSFLLGDPANTSPRGIGTGDPLVNGSGQTGSGLVTDGWSPTQREILRPGDWIQLGGFNRILWSQDFTNAAWTKNNVTATANSATAPDGTSTASLLESAASDSYVAQGYYPYGTFPHTISMWLKSPSGDVPVSISNQNFISGSFEFLTDITVTTSWQRFEFEFTPFGVGLAVLYIGGFASFSFPEKLYVWGVQIEPGNVAGRYNATTSSEYKVGPRLHKIVNSASTGLSGEATLSIWPSLRSSPSDNAPITVNSPRGKFMLANNETEWSIDVAQQYGLSFTAIEDLRP